ncbi:MAG: hypothetical protein AAGB29_13340 [Planctomycetota bacterium]
MTAESTRLPSRPSIENLRKQAKTLLRRRRDAGDDELKLSQCQHDIAVEHGFASWPRLLAHLNELNGQSRVKRDGDRVWIEGVPRLRWGASPEPTYLGALEVAFRGSDRPLDLTTLMGDSGLTYRVRWAREVEADRWCGSTPVGEWPAEREALNRSTGYVFDWEWPDENAEKPVARIVEHIDAGRPILAYGKQLDMSVIYGYEADGDRVLVRDYWASDDPLVMPTQEIKGVTAWLIDETEPMPRREAVEAGLRLATERWTHGVEDTPYEPATRFYYGSLAYEQWTADVDRAESLSEEARANLFFLNGWNYSSLYRNRRDHAARYLRASASQLPDTVRPAVEAAAGVYDDLAMFLGKWDVSDPMFGFAKQKPAAEWSADTRRREIAHLRRVAELDADAQRHLAEAVAALSETASG